MKIVLRFLYISVFLMAFTASAFSVGAFSFPNLVNEYFPLEKNYEPAETIDISKYIKTTRSPLYMESEAANNYIEMIKACNADGIKNVSGQSGLRSYAYQQSLFNNKIRKLKNAGYSAAKAYNEGKMVVALPGASEHQTGLAIDISIDGTLTERFASTKGGKWLADNSYKYGFVLRYPDGKSDITGIIYEPWHFRYVGKVHAQIMTLQNLCLEEYYLKYAIHSFHPLAPYVFEMTAQGKLCESCSLNPDMPITVQHFLNLFGIENTFGFENTDSFITRAQTAQILCDYLKIDLEPQTSYNFTDCENIDINLQKALSAMYERGIFCTFDNNCILPNGTITIAQCANIACDFSKA